MNAHVKFCDQRILIFGVVPLAYINSQITFLGPAIKNYYSQEIKVYAVGRNTYFKNTQKHSCGNFKGN
jgi:hypothetical protein